MQEHLLDGKYRIMKVIGRGGMGTVYLAENVKLGVFWAIKAVNKNSSKKIDLLAEPNILKKLNHPALPRIFDIIEDSENIYIIEDYVEGISLDSELKEVKRFPEKTVVGWAKELCNVLIYLHNIKPNPIIYRDMKPSNIIISNDGNIKLIDFGIAREYKRGSKSDTSYIGTRGYAAPEQYGTSQTDARTDIYGLGVTLYHLLTGKSPNEPPYEIRPVRQLDNNFSEGIEKIIEKCTRQDPQKRYQSAQQLLNDLNNIEKFNSDYKRKRLLRKLRSALFTALILFFSFLTYAGILQLKHEKIEAYETQINEGIKLANENKFDSALEILKQATSKMPKRLDSYREIAYVYLKENDYDKCINYIHNEVLNKIENSSTDGDMLYILGTAYFNKQEYSRAIDCFEKAKNDNPNNINYKRDLAVSYARNGNLDKASLILNEIVKKGTADEVTWYVNGEIMAAKKDFEGAISNFEKCMSDAKDEELKQRSFIATAQLYKKNKDSIRNAPDREISVLEKACSELKEKNNIIITEMLGEAYYNKAMDDTQHKTEYLNKSVSNFNQLIKSGYKMPYVYKNIGIIYQQMGAFDKSEEAYLKMKELNPEDFHCYLQLALLYADMESKKTNELRNYDKTYENYKLAVKYCPNGEKNMELKPLINLINELKENNWIQ